MRIENTNSRREPDNQAGTINWGMKRWLSATI